MFPKGKGGKSGAGIADIRALPRTLSPEGLVDLVSRPHREISLHHQKNPTKNESPTT